MTTRSLLPPLAVCLALAGCAPEISESPPASDESGLRAAFSYGASYTASVVVNLPSGNMCTGTLLTNHWVLTSAACTQGVAAGGYGSIGYATGGQGGYASGLAYYGPMEVFRHPSWTGGTAYNIGLVHLMNGSEVSGLRAEIYADPTQRPWTSDLGSQETYVEGFGSGSTSGNNCSSPNLYDRSRYVDARNGSSTTIQTDYIDCPGDAGGPWAYWLWSPAEQMYHFLQYAITSGHSGTFTQSTVAAVVSPYRSWILQTINARMQPDGVEHDDHVLTTQNGASHSYWKLRETGYAGLLQNGNGWCLKATGYNDLAPVTLARCNAGDQTQVWAYSPEGWFGNWGTGSFLDAYAVEGSPVRTTYHYDPAAHYFRWDRNTIHTNDVHGLCVDVKNSQQYEGVPVWIYPCNGTSAQYFAF